MYHLSLNPTLCTYSSDTILRGIFGLPTTSTTYDIDTGRNYNFDATSKLIILLVKTLFSTGHLVTEELYDLDVDHQFIETEKYNGKFSGSKIA